jgi:hypothetical protein
MEVNPNPPGAPAEKLSVLDRPWLHWGSIVAGFYLLTLVILTLPFICACFPSDAVKNGLRHLPYDIYEAWQYWMLMGWLAVSQFLLLRVPVRLTTKRPVRRSAVWLPIVVSGFWFGCLIVGLGFSVMELRKIEANLFPWLVIGFAVLTWIAWSVIFFAISRNKEPGDVVKRQTSWLLRGSVLELLIAVPSHIVARGRTDCCAGFFTFVGITMGVSVMLLSFGPAVFVLYYARWHRLRRAD